MDEKLLSTSEAADMLGIAERTVVLWYQKGHFPDAFKLNPFARNSPLRIPLSNIEAIQKKRQTGPLPQPES